MGEVISIITRQPIIQNEMIGSDYFKPRTTSYSGDWNKVMHLRAHGWTEMKGIWAHPQVLNGSFIQFDEAWQAQKSIELGRRYWNV